MAFGPISVEMDTFADCVGSCCEPVACPERMGEMAFDELPFNLTIELEEGCAGDPCQNDGTNPTYDCFPWSGTSNHTGGGLEMRWGIGSGPQPICNCGSVELLCEGEGQPGLVYATSCCVPPGANNGELISIQYSPLVMVFRISAGYFGYCGAIFNEDTLSYDCEDCNVILTFSE